MSEAEQKPATPQWPVRVKLKHPVDFAGETISSLEFRRGKLGDLKGMKLDGLPPVDHLMLVASRMCGQPLKVLESLDGEDAGEVLELALTFFVSCLGTGTKP